VNNFSMITLLKKTKFHKAKKNARQSQVPLINISSLKTAELGTVS